MTDHPVMVKNLRYVYPAKDLEIGDTFRVPLNPAEPLLPIRSSLMNHIQASLQAYTYFTAHGLDKEFRLVETGTEVICTRTK